VQENVKWPIAKGKRKDKAIAVFSATALFSPQNSLGSGSDTWKRCKYCPNHTQV
jgi:hypothetical protein